MVAAEKEDEAHPSPYRLDNAPQQLGDDLRQRPAHADGRRDVVELVELLQLLALSDELCEPAGRGVEDPAHSERGGYRE